MYLPRSSGHAMLERIVDSLKDSVCPVGHAIPEAPRIAWAHVKGCAWQLRQGQTRYARFGDTLYTHRLFAEDVHAMRQHVDCSDPPCACVPSSSPSTSTPDPPPSKLTCSRAWPLHAPG